MPDHVTSNGATVPCSLRLSGRCRTCELIDRAGPHYREDYRRLFHAEEFPDVPPIAWQAPEPIGLMAKAGNLATATMEHVAAGLPVADEATQAMRMETCRACVGPTGGIDGGPGYWDGASGECRHPTCNCKMRVKTWWREQKCPIGKW